MRTIILNGRNHKLQDGFSSITRKTLIEMSGEPSFARVFWTTNTGLGELLEGEHIDYDPSLIVKIFVV